jgi:hypothetical protein
MYDMARMAANNMERCAQDGHHALAAYWAYTSARFCGDVLLELNRVGVTDGLTVEKVRGYKRALMALADEYEHV